MLLRIKFHLVTKKKKKNSISFGLFFCSFRLRVSLQTLIFAGDYPTVWRRFRSSVADRSWSRLLPSSLGRLSRISSLFLFCRRAAPPARLRCVRRCLLPFFTGGRRRSRVSAFSVPKF